MTLDFRVLDDDPILDNFDCSNQSIEDMIKGSYFAVVRKQATAYAVLQNELVVAYCQINIGAIQYEADVYDSSDNSYGAIWIKYIVVDRPLRGKNIGQAIMKTLIKWAKDLCDSCPIRFLALNALTECCDWYENLGFQFFTEKDVQKSTNLMYMDFINREQLEIYIKERQE